MSAVKPYFDDGTVSLYLGDCRDVLAMMEADSVDAVVCDPPYGLEFMGRDWDAPWRGGINADAGFSTVGLSDGSDRLPRPTFTGSTNPHCRNCKGRQRGRRDGTAIWKTCTCDKPDFPNVRATEMRAFQEWCEGWAAECLRVLKPGGHLLAFGGTRTWHRLTCAIEDAGFEIRDSIADLTGIDGPGLLWTYAQGFPKSLDVSKAIDKAGGNPLAFREFARAFAAAVAASDLTFADIDRHLGIKASSCFWVREDYRGGMPPRHHWAKVCKLLDLPAELEKLYDAAEREVVATGYRVRRESTVQIVGLSDGEYDITAPATATAARWEGWGTALKPAWEPIAVARKPLAGTVARNVLEFGTGALNVAGCIVPHAGEADLAASKAKNPGRSDLFTSDTYGTSRPQQSVNDAGRWPPNVVLGEEAAAEMGRQSAGSARIFPIFKYEPKAPKSERPKLPDGTAWPTVKPLDLMRWLVRLVTPPNGLVLDLFAGSGTTGEACVIEGFRCILIDKDPVAAELIRTRLSKPIQPAMFGFDEAG